MIAVLDASAAIGVSLQKPGSKKIEEVITSAEWTIAPDLFVSEVTNVFWKYHQFEDLPLDNCTYALQTSISLVDDLIPSTDLHVEAFSLACQLQHSVYDALYLVSARRYNAVLLSLESKLLKLAKKQSIRTL